MRRRTNRKLNEADAPLSLSSAPHPQLGGHLGNFKISRMVSIERYLFINTFQGLNYNPVKPNRWVHPIPGKTRPLNPVGGTAIRGSRHEISRGRPRRGLS